MATAASTPAAATPAPLSFSVRWRLSLMMFLQYAIWGAWLPLLWPYLANKGFSETQIGSMFAVGAIGSIFAPFIAGQIADRFFPTQWFLGLSHLIGAALVWQLANLKEYEHFLWFSLGYSLVFSPTLSLTNSLAFHHLPDRDRDFGHVRVFGTFGWILAGIGVAQWLFYQYTPTGEGITEEAIAAAQASGMGDAFRLSAILGGILGVFCFLLPHTPPKGGSSPFATWEARGEVQRNSKLMALFMFSIVISCVHQFYFVHTSGFLRGFQNKAEDINKVVNRVFGVGGLGLMTIGQISELFVLAAMPFLAKRLSRKTLLSMGIIAYGLRMGLFAYVTPIADKLGISEIPILMTGIAMHGLCFGCYIFVAFMVVDEETTTDVRASAQSLFNLVIIGFGVIVGSLIASTVAEWAKIAPKVYDYQKLFSVPMWASILCLVAFLFLYPSRKAGEKLTN